jgi:AraC-like DNA-binding protein
MPETNQHSATTGWVLAVIRALAAAGEDSDAMLAEIGMDPSLLEGGHCRYSQQQVSALWRRAAAACGDGFCLQVAAEVKPATFHVVGYAMNCSATLGRSLQRFARYCRLISDSATATLSEHGNCVTLAFHFDTGGQPPIYQMVDTVLASVFSFARWISGGQLTPLEVRVRHAMPSDPDPYGAFFGGPVLYRQGQDSITFRKADLDRPILSADEELATLLDGAANRHLDKRMAGRLGVRVRDLLIAQLPNGAPSKTDIAKMLNMTERTLLRRLKDEGTTFADVINQLREELAFQYLRRDGMTISEIACLLGFSDEGTFSRAFKRWTGRRPSMVARTDGRGRRTDIELAEAA